MVLPTVPGIEAVTFVNFLSAFRCLSDVVSQEVGALNVAVFAWTGAFAAPVPVVDLEQSVVLRAVTVRVRLGCVTAALVLDQTYPVPHEIFFEAMFPQLMHETASRERFGFRTNAEDNQSENN